MKEMSSALRLAGVSRQLPTLFTNGLQSQFPSITIHTITFSHPASSWNVLNASRLWGDMEENGYVAFPNSPIAYNCNQEKWYDKHVFHRIFLISRLFVFPQVWILWTRLCGGELPWNLNRQSPVQSHLLWRRSAERPWKLHESTAQNWRHTGDAYRGSGKRCELSGWHGADARPDCYSKFKT